MDIALFYFAAALPVVVGGVVWVFNKEIHWGEWVANSVLCFVLAGSFHLISNFGAARDTETWSGQLTSGRHYGKWQEYYEEAVYKTEYYYDTESYYDSNGKRQTRRVRKSRRVFSHWEGHRRWHDEHYRLASNIDTGYNVDRSTFYKIADTWGGVKTVPGDRRTGEHNSRMIGGDPNDYVTSNTTRFIWPVTKLVSFENKVRAVPTAFSYSKVPETIKVFPYPENSDPFRSDRLVGTANLLDIFAFDQMNARLGPGKRVNVILVGFGDKDSMMAQWQEAEWVGGKKNDVVICWGGSNKSPTWVRAFGWTDSKTCLRNLETIVLQNGATNETLPMIEQEIIKGYKLKEWEESFAHIRVPAPTWAVITFFSVMVVSQAGFWWWAQHNSVSKEGRPSRYRYRRFRR